MLFILSCIDDGRMRQSVYPPQVLLPGKRTFKTHETRRVFKVDLALKKERTDAQKPIVITQKQAVLWYPRHVLTPVRVKPYKNKRFRLMKKIQWEKEKASSVIELLRKHMATLGNIAQDPQAFPALNELEQQRAQKEEEEEEEQEQETTQNIRETMRTAAEYLYPEFISMKRGDATHHITHIQVKNPHSPYAGVLQFIRDAFLDISYRPTRKTFKIDKLTGNNDICLAFEALRHAGIIKKVHPLEQALRQHMNKRITLKDVIIQTESLSKDTLDINISFVVGKDRWICSNNAKSRHLWDFKRLVPPTTTPTRKKGKATTQKMRK